MVVNLIVIDMVDFDVIFNIDFLNKYGAKIDCKKKKVQVNLGNSEKLTFRKG